MVIGRCRSDRVLGELVPALCSSTHIPAEALNAGLDYLDPGESGQNVNMMMLLL